MTQACELCTEKHPREIYRNDMFYVLDASDDDLPFFLRIVCARHVEKLNQLTTLEREFLFRLLGALEVLFYQFGDVDKVNIASLGNMVPHMHWHVIGRWQDDAYFPNSIWAEKLRTPAESLMQERRKKAKEFLNALPAYMHVFEIGFAGSEPAFSAGWKPAFKNHTRCSS